MLAAVRFAAFTSRFLTVAAAAAAFTAFRLAAGFCVVC